MAARARNSVRRIIFSSSARFRSSCSWRISSWNLLVSNCSLILASKKHFAPPTPTSSTLISVRRANSLKPDPESKSPALAFLLAWNRNENQFKIQFYWHLETNIIKCFRFTCKWAKILGMRFFHLYLRQLQQSLLLSRDVFVVLVIFPS